MDQKRYITKDSVRDMIMGWSGGFDYIEEPVEGALEDLRGIPTVDAVPVVRCRECILHDSCYTEDVFKFARLNDDSRFCGVGKRKGGDE